MSEYGWRHHHNHFKRFLQLCHENGISEDPRKKPTNETPDTMILFTVKREVKSEKKWDLFDKVRQAMVAIWKYGCHFNDG